VHDYSVTHHNVNEADWSPRLRLVVGPAFSLHPDFSLRDFS
jgi:hypothetical protein